MKHLRTLLLLAAFQLFSLLAFPQAEPEAPPPFEPYACSLGTVIGYEGNVYRIDTGDGRVIGIAAQTEPSPEAVEADIAAPQPAPPLHQSLEVVLTRLTDAELTALLDSTNPNVRRFVELAKIRGQIRQDNADFIAAAALLDSLDIVASERWPTLLAP